MNAPALKVTQYLRDLDDRTRPMTQLQLRSIIKDCKRTLEQVSSYEAVPLYTAMAFAARRLELYADGYRYAQCAAKLDPNSHVGKLNLGAALVDVGKHYEAMDLFASLSGSDVVPGYLIFANTAECLARIGLNDDARSAFQDALSVANMSDPQVLIVLAEQAALIDAQDAALELVARAVARCTNTEMGERSALDIIADAPIPLRQAIDEKSALRLAIERARAFAGIPRFAMSTSEVIENHSGEDLELADRETMAVFEATKGMRSRANQAVLSEAENARS